MLRRFCTHGLAGVASAVVIGLCWSAAASAQSGIAGRLAAEQADILERLPGVWSNELQVFFADEVETPAAEIPPRQVWTIEPEGEDGLRVVPDGDDDGRVVLRWRADVDVAPPMVRVAADDDPARCRLDWRREAGGFVGEGDCPALGVTRLAVHGDFLRLEPTEGPAVELRRARPFTCWSSVLRGARHGDSGADATPQDWWGQPSVKLHDQGGVATLITDETPPRRIDVRMRRVEWPYGRNRPSLVLYVHQDQETRATSYAWAAYDAQRIGLNLRWMQISCTHTPDEE